MDKKVITLNDLKEFIFKIRLDLNNIESYLDNYFSDDFEFFYWRWSFIDHFDEFKKSIDDYFDYIPSYSDGLKK